MTTERDAPSREPSPLVGEGREGGAPRRRHSWLPVFLRRPAPLTDASPAAAPPPFPPPQGGRVARGGASSLIHRLALGLAALPVLGFAALAGLFALDRAYPPPLAPSGPPSAIVLDRNGRLLSAFTTASGRWRLPIAGTSVDQRFLEMLIAYEDRRFAEHGGLDVRAIGRAALQAAESGRIVSGASTLTMQAARITERTPERTIGRKIHESLRALQLERRLTKAEILDLYLAGAPYGGNLEGIRAASLAYFGREPERLTTAEAALLVALPQSPETRRPDRHPEAARAARSRVLDRMVRLGVVSPAEAEAARAEPVPGARREFPRLAAHAARTAAAARPERAVHQLTIDRDLQASLEALVADRAAALGPRVSGAAVVIDEATGDVLARVASAGLLDDARGGHVDMSLAVRSPGSTLKPFIYGLAFEAGIAHPSTLVEDRPTTFGGYAPKNFDDGYKGTVTAREALQQSLNVPAVALLEAVGPTRLAVRLQDAGVRLVLPTAEAPSLAIGLGGVGIRLVDLAALYAGLAKGGVVPEVREVMEAEETRDAALAPTPSSFGKMRSAAAQERSPRQSRVRTRVPSSAGVAGDSRIRSGEGAEGTSRQARLSLPAPRQPSIKSPQPDASPMAAPPPAPAPQGGRVAGALTSASPSPPPGSTVAWPPGTVVHRTSVSLSPLPAFRRRILDPVAAWHVADVLAGTPPPANAAGGRIAFKTGTSYGYRDGWAAGFDGRHAVAVWLGRPDGAPVAGLVAREAAAPMLFDAFARISPRRAPLARAPDGALIATTATLPPPLRAFGAAADGPARAASAARGVRFAYPPDGARVSLDDGAGGRQPLAWRVEGPSRRLTLLVDGRPAGMSARERAGSVAVPGRGYVRLTVVDDAGSADSVTVFVE
jgi:membrane carboxypeptidase/penicillin-binding protein PbpC